MSAGQEHGVDDGGQRLRLRLATARRLRAKIGARTRLEGRCLALEGPQGVAGGI